MKRSIESNINKAIEKICIKSTWHDSYSRLAALTVKNQKPVFRLGLLEYMYKISGPYSFLFGQDVRYKHTDPQTPTVKIGISSKAARLT